MNLIAKISIWIIGLSLAAPPVIPIIAAALDSDVSSDVVIMDVTNSCQRIEDEKEQTNSLE